MGMDVMGRKPKSETGAYFRRNVWGWHPLADLIENLFPWASPPNTFWHSNDGWGLNATQSKRLAKELSAATEDGRIAFYIKERDDRIASLPKEECPYCNGTGVRTDEIGVELGMDEKLWCNGCDGKGAVSPWETNYHCDIQDVNEFTAFLKDCGGFHIY